MDREHPDSGHPFTPGPTMTLRDYFAGQALRGFFHNKFLTPTYESVAESCYGLADAMLKAREVKP
jgi:hypothetical protein